MTQFFFQVPFAPPSVLLGSVSGRFAIKNLDVRAKTTSKKTPTLPMCASLKNRAQTEADAFAICQLQPASIRTTAHTSATASLVMSVSTASNAQVRISGFPRGIESIEKALNCEIGFQHLEKVLNLAILYIKY